MNARTDLGRFASVLAVVLFAIVAGACGSSSNSSPTTPTPTPDPGAGGGSSTPTFSQIQSQILTPYCTVCHSDSGGRADDLILSAGSAYGNLVNVPSNEKSGAIRVIPGDPDNSYLIQKLQGTPGIIGLRMPRNGPPYLTDAQILLVRQWIAAGAPNN